ncbi:AraC family transcriptional regulator [Paenibacillus pasadenensis]|uniref:AraC family transcriptional regulator n=1 Tax=Paenibacillus pasadenensis TaxID=217090 RepID=UPI00203B6396|nr:AraC family transcriptional regulator [Paenibacillus pasadenensis]MCM3749379.1 AraC family transcriptional regulator [Paenibacillus pasadenensis]
MNYSFTSHKTDDRSNVDLALYECGEEQYHPHYHVGPAARDYFLIHYIDRGKGIFKTKNQTYEVNKGDGFIIYPGEVVYYGVEEDDPWHCYWVGFHGMNTLQYLEQCGLSETNRLFHFDDDSLLVENMSSIIQASSDFSIPYIKSLGLLYIFFSLLTEQHNKENNHFANISKENIHVLQAVQYIQHQYMHDIKISDLADRLGFNRSYFCSIFKKYMMVSPKQYLMNIRIARACELMKHSDLNISEIARSTGFNDPLYFSKIFKRQRFHSPQVYKSQELWKQEDNSIAQK